MQVPPFVRKHRVVLTLAFLVLWSGAVGWWLSQAATGEPRFTKQDECAKICAPLSSHVEKRYLDPMSPEGRRNMPIEYLCMCGTSVTGKPL
jgi:hypothetical protein